MASLRAADEYYFTHKKEQQAFERLFVRAHTRAYTFAGGVVVCPQGPGAPLKWNRWNVDHVLAVASRWS
eukprot:6899672-Prymnesium_polylepis.1